MVELSVIGVTFSDTVARDDARDSGTRRTLEAVVRSVRGRARRMSSGIRREHSGQVIGGDVVNALCGVAAPDEITRPRDPPHRQARGVLDRRLMTRRVVAELSISGRSDSADSERPSCRRLVFR